MASVSYDVSEDTIVKSIIDFVLEFSSPELADEDHIILGQENFQTLPDDGNDFIVITPLSQNRRGTGTQRISDDLSKIEITSYNDVLVQIDSYSSNINDARVRAQTLETITRTSIATSFFKTYSIDLQFADQIQNMSAALDSGVYVSRWTFNLHLGYWHKISAQIGSFDKIKLHHYWTKPEGSEDFPEGTADLYYDAIDRHIKEN